MKKTLLRLLLVLALAIPLTIVLPATALAGSPPDNSNAPSFHIGGTYLDVFTPDTYFGRMGTSAGQIRIIDIDPVTGWGTAIGQEEDVVHGTEGTNFNHHRTDQDFVAGKVVENYPFDIYIYDRTKTPPYIFDKTITGTAGILKLTPTAYMAFVDGGKDGPDYVLAGAAEAEYDSLVFLCLPQWQHCGKSLTRNRSDRFGRESRFASGLPFFESKVEEGIKIYHCLVKLDLSQKLIILNFILEKGGFLKNFFSFC